MSVKNLEMIQGYLFLKCLRHFTSKLYRLNDIDIDKIDKQFCTYRDVRQVFKNYNQVEYVRKIKKNNSFRFNLKFYLRHKRFFNVLKQTKFQNKYCYKITKNCIYTNPNVFSKSKLYLIDYPNVLYENIARDFLYIIACGGWRSYHEFAYTYLNDLPKFYNIQISKEEIEYQIKRTALASLPFLLKTIKKNKKPRDLTHSYYFIQELYVDKYL